MRSMTTSDNLRPTHADRPYEELVAEAVAAPTEGWDFSWFDGRATEERPSWGYARLMGERLAGAESALDLHTGGGEVLNLAPKLPSLMAATEGWPPNVEKATRLLGPRGVVVVASPDDAPLPFADAAFELVTARHPVKAHFTEIARVLRPGGTYFAQHVGPSSVFELVEYFLGPQPAEVREGVTRTRSSARRRRPDWTSSTCAPSGCASSFMTSGPLSTFCARSYGWSLASQLTPTIPNSGRCTSRSSGKGRSWPTAAAISSRHASRNWRLWPPP